MTRKKKWVLACKMANHAHTRTVQFYDRRSDTASLVEYEKVGI